MTAGPQPREVSPHGDEAGRGGAAGGVSMSVGEPSGDEPGGGGTAGVSMSVGEPSGDEFVSEGMLYRLGRLASLPIEHLNHATWGQELLDACTAILPSGAGTVWLLDGQARISLACVGQEAIMLDPTERWGDGRRWARCSQARGPVVVETSGASTTQVALPIREGAELRGLVELHLARTGRSHRHPSAVLDAAQWLVDVAARVLTNLEAYRREREAGETLQRLLDRA